MCNPEVFLGLTLYSLVPLQVNSIRGFLAFLKALLLRLVARRSLVSIQGCVCLAAVRFGWYMVLYYLVNGGVDVFPHAVDGVEGCKEPVAITDKCLLDPFSISLLPQ